MSQTFRCGVFARSMAIVASFALPALALAQPDTITNSKLWIMRTNNDPVRSAIDYHICLMRRDGGNIMINRSRRGLAATMIPIQPPPGGGFQARGTLTGGANNVPMPCIDFNFPNTPIAPGKKANIDISFKSTGTPQVKITAEWWTYPGGVAGPNLAQAGLNYTNGNRSFQITNDSGANYYLHNLQVMAYNTTDVDFDFLVDDSWFVPNYSPAGYSGAPMLIAQGAASPDFGLTDVNGDTFHQSWTYFRGVVADSADLGTATDQAMFLYGMQTIPEPSAGALGIIGFVLIVSRRRRCL
jgi:hypothetical protein